MLICAKNIEMYKQPGRKGERQRFDFAVNRPFKKKKQKTESPVIFLVQNLNTRLFDERMVGRYKPSVRNEPFPVTPLEICKKS